MTTFICSVGTSSAKLLGIRPPETLAGWVEERGGALAAAPLIAKTFLDQAPAGKALTATLSAEIHSLARMGLSSQDRVLLLCSGTADGEACGRAVALYLEAHWPGAECVCRRVEGVQVYDAQAFRRVGVIDYVQQCLAAVQAYGAEYCVLNPTGGFKALVPYTVMIGMLRGVRCRYVFERSTTIMDLPPLPVDFDGTLFECFKPILERIERETAVPEAEVMAPLPPAQRTLLEALVEKEGDQVTISALGFLFLEQVRKPIHLVPFLSQRAWVGVRALAGRSDCDPHRFIERVSADPRQLDRHEHINLGQGLRWLKPGNTPDRYLVCAADWRLLVWEVADKGKTPAMPATRTRAASSPTAPRSTPRSPAWSGWIRECARSNLAIEAICIGRTRRGRSAGAAMARRMLEQPKPGSGSGSLSLSDSTPARGRPRRRPSAWSRLRTGIAPCRRRAANPGSSQSLPLNQGLTAH